MYPLRAPNGGNKNGIPPNRFVMLAKNARISSAAQITQLLADLADISWDVVLFFETHSPSGKHILDGGHILCTHLGENKYAGVGILLHAKHVRDGNRIHCISGRVLALDFMAGPSRVRAVAVYAPHAGYDWFHFEETLEQLS